MFWRSYFLLLLLGITTSMALKTMKCIPSDLNTDCFVKNESYHDENEAIIFNTDGYKVSDHDVVLFETSNGFNNFSVFPNAIFEKFPYLRTVTVNEAQLKMLNKKSFSNCLGLITINLIKNLIERLDAGVFEQCENLENLNIGMNLITSVDKDAFRNLWSLQTLTLWYNSITTLHQDTFNNHPNLLVLSLTHNQITTLHNDTFKQLSSMFTVDFSYNKIVTIESGLFNLPLLSSIRLGHNRINAIHPNFFEYWPPKNLISSISLEYNFCVGKDFVQLGSKNVSTASVKPEFAKCFKNYLRPKLTPGV